MALQLVHLTDQGAVRQTNQDSYCARIANFGPDTIALLAVCDGMGGLQCGELASTAAVRGFEEWFDRELPGIMRDGLQEDQLFISWHALLERLHGQLCTYAQQQGIRMGTTVSVLLAARSTLYFVQIGDSRIYLDDSFGMQLLTKDQTLAMSEYEAGRLPLEQLASDRRSGILLQCLGFGRVEPVFASTPRPAQGAVLLCSDGFYHKVPPELMHRAVADAQDRSQLQQMLGALAEHCRTQGETDNLTAVILRWNDTADLPPDGEEWVEIWARLSGQAAPQAYEQTIGGVL